MWAASRYSNNFNLSKDNFTFPHLILLLFNDEYIQFFMHFEKEKGVLDINFCEFYT